MKRHIGIKQKIVQKLFKYYFITYSINLKQSKQALTITTFDK
jgi:hypothetical protein